MKKLFALLLALAIGLTCCGFAMAEEAPAELTVVVIRRVTDITESYSEKHWVKESEEAANVKINWIELVEGQHAEPLAALLAGDLPDVFWVNKLSDNMVLTNARLWQPLTVDEIRDKVPNAYALYEKYFPDWQEFLTYPDGNIYSLMTRSKTAPLSLAQGLMYVNYQWLDNLGLEPPATLEEFHDMLVAFKEQDANGNGDPDDEIPIDFCNNHYAANIMNFACMWGIANSSSVFYNIEDGNVVGTLNTPAFREFLEYFYQLGQEGLLNLEGFSQTEDQYNANLDALRGGVFWGWAPYNYIQSDAKLQYQALIPPAAESYETKILPNAPIMCNRNGFIITTACKDKDAALRWFNWMSEPINAINIANGAEEIFWKMIDDDLHYIVLSYPTQEEMDAAIADVYPELVGKSFNGGNTLGYVNNCPFLPYQNMPDLSDSTANTTVRYVAMQLYKDAGALADPMSQSIVTSEQQEELDFQTDGLKNAVNSFVAESIINGVTDASWDNFQDELERCNYGFYIDWYNRRLHNEL